MKLVLKIVGTGGGCKGVTIPKDVMKRLDLELGDYVEIDIKVGEKENV